MTYEIYCGDTLVNTIISDESFAAAYCKTNGYSFIERRPAPVLDFPPTELEQLRADVDFLAAMTGVMLV